MNKARFEAFSDGVFAFATTLLVLGFVLPGMRDPSNLDVTRSLLHLWPKWSASIARLYFSTSCFWGDRLHFVRDQHAGVVPHVQSVDAPLPPHAFVLLDGLQSAARALGAAVGFRALGEFGNRNVDRSRLSCRMGGLRDRHALGAGSSGREFWRVSRDRVLLSGAAGRRCRHQLTSPAVVLARPKVRRGSIASPRCSFECRTRCDCS